jgi:hypothetical protein
MAQLGFGLHIQANIAALLKSPQFSATTVVILIVNVVMVDPGRARAALPSLGYRCARVIQVE